MVKVKDCGKQLYLKEKLMQVFLLGAIFFLVMMFLFGITTVIPHGICAVPLILYALLIVLPRSASKPYGKYTKGILGERKVVKVLKKELDDSYYLLNDVEIKSKGGNIDHILLSSKGIFVIETKNLKGKIECDEDDWTYSYSNRPLRSFSKQVKKNAVDVKELLGIRYVYPLLVFTDPSMKLRLNHETVTVLRLNELGGYIKKLTSQTSFNDAEIGEMIKKIECNLIP
jgi:hypothetical protein